MRAGPLADSTHEASALVVTSKVASQNTYRDLATSTQCSGQDVEVRQDRRNSISPRWEESRGGSGVISEEPRVIEQRGLPQSNDVLKEALRRVDQARVRQGIERRSQSNLMSRQALLRVRVYFKAGSDTAHQKPSLTNSCRRRTNPSRSRPSSCSEASISS